LNYSMLFIGENKIKPSLNHPFDGVSYALLP
jgi:hypothetical protein